MHALYNAFLLTLAAATDRELARHVEFLKAENRILRGKLPKRIAISTAERQRLLSLGKLTGDAIKHLVTIVSPRTFMRWLSDESKTAKTPNPVSPGRPKIETDTRELVLRLARENGWGYTRILGELRKLGVTNISRSTVVNILRSAGIDPSPERANGRWHTFIREHLATLWACDFFTKKIWTTAGLVDCYVLFFIHLGTRRVIVTGMSAHPDSAWVAQQARNFNVLADVKPTHLIHDLDTKFTQQFDEILGGDGAEIVKVGPLAPNLNAHAERWVLSIKSECLDHFIVFGEDHLRHLATEYLAHYNGERPHQGLENVPLSEPHESLKDGEVLCFERLGGRLKHYERKAA